MDIRAFGVEEWLNQWEKEANYDLAGSSIASLTMEEVLNLCPQERQDLEKAIQSAVLNYGWIEGSPAFKTEVAKLYQTISPDQILQTNGATGANFLALYALLEPADHVICLYPTYQQLSDIPRSLGCQVDLWEVREDKGWLPSLDDLRQLITPKTKMICINNANNPTGAVMERAFLEEVVRLAREVDAYVLVDEVYQSFDQTVDRPAIADLYDRGISVNSLSKTYSVPGIRVGWVASSRDIAELFRKYRDYTMICAGVLDDLLACHVLKHKEQVLGRNRAIVEENLAILSEWVAGEERVDLVLPKLISTAFIKLSIPEATEKFCLDLLKEQGVLLVPGERFDRPGYARLGYCCHTETLKKGLGLLSDYLRKYDKL